MTLQSAGATEVEELGPWFHNLHLPDGLETAPDHPLGDFPAFKWRQIAPSLPGNLSGWRALDIGCNAGFYSFELARRGAEVTGIDADEHYLRQARWAAERLGLDATFRQASVYDLARWDERFDLVLFLGVLYHLRYPLLGLDLVAEKVERLLVFQTLTMPDRSSAETPSDLRIDERQRLLEPGWPKLAFVEHRLAGDPTNWWVANETAVEALLRSAGLEPCGRPGHEIWLCRPAARRPDRDELHAASGR
jgi:tRNA (mo5U34)-methyltransferase